VSLAVTISPTQSNVLAALGAFLSTVLPGISGQSPAVFLGTISGTTLTVAAIPGITPAGIVGTIALGAPVLGATPGTIITAFLTGAGGVGTYQVNLSQTVATAKTMSTGVAAVAGQPNRVPEPNNPFFVVMTPMRFTRLSTNVDGSADAKFTASISGSTMTVSAVQTGTIVPGALVFGANVATAVINQLTGTPGGAGTYLVSPSLNVSSETMSAGTKTLMQSAEIDVQLDFHSSDLTSSDFAQIVSTTLRDEYAVSFFKALSAPLNGVTPLLADDPAQQPFINDQNQFEYRWVTNCRLQVDQIVSISQEYADSITVTLKDVAPPAYPP
jgi:hypothetical protein